MQRFSLLFSVLPYRRFWAESSGFAILPLPLDRLFCLYITPSFPKSMDDKISDQQVKLLNDALTGVLSRFAYIDAINAYTASVPENLAVFMIDINGLKTVNDTLGHKAGDELICGAAKCIKRSLGNAGNTFRIGGDEFVVFAAMTREQASDALIDLKYKTEIWSGKIVKNLSLSVGCHLHRIVRGCQSTDW